MYEKFKKEAERYEKKLKNQEHLDPKLIQSSKLDPLLRLEDYRASREGVDEAKPFGIDKSEAIKVMSFYGELEIAKKGMNKQQLKRMIESIINHPSINGLDRLQ